MKNSINPVIAGTIVLILILGLGMFLWKQTGPGSLVAGTSAGNPATAPPTEAAPGATSSGVPVVPASLNKK